jgi:hypothetical protein
LLADPFVLADFAFFGSLGQPVIVLATAIVVTV